jgi:hypothetical protein
MRWVVWTHHLLIIARFIEVRQNEIILCYVCVLLSILVIGLCVPEVVHITIALYVYVLCTPLCILIGSHARLYVPRVYAGGCGRW